MVIQGNTSGSIATVPFNIPCKIISGYFTNKTGGNIVLNVYVATGGGNNRSLSPLNLTMISGVQFIINEEVILSAGMYLIIVANGSVDYYLSVNPTN